MHLLSRSKYIADAKLHERKFPSLSVVLYLCFLLMEDVEMFGMVIKFQQLNVERMFLRLASTAQILKLDRKYGGTGSMPLRF